jgi:hypothetical protein
MTSHIVNNTTSFITSFTMGGRGSSPPAIAGQRFDPDQTSVVLSQNTQQPLPSMEIKRMYVQEEVRKLESAETRNKELQIRTKEAGRMRKEIARLEKENAMLRGRARDDESAHEEMLGVVQSLYGEMIGLIEENAQTRSNGVTKRSVSPNFNPEKRAKKMTDTFN